MYELLKILNEQNFSARVLIDVDFFSLSSNLKIHYSKNYSLTFSHIILVLLQVPTVLSSIWPTELISNSSRIENFE